MNIESIIKERNKGWKKKPEIPEWVDLEDVSLDQFFTKPEIAKKYYLKTLKFLKKENINIEDCLFVEPSAGDGSFFKLLPKNQRIGLDLYPMAEGIIKKDFLNWTPPKTDKKIIFIGNPPFGYRAWLALNFMNHASKFADYIFFILPMSFQSEGKGSSKYRVKNMKLIHSEIIPNDSFYEPNGKIVKINALWQYWTKGENKIPNFNLFNKYIDIFTVDQRKERLCGQEKMDKADFFIQRTFYNEAPKLVKNFSDVKYTCGYGIILKKKKKLIKKILSETNWEKHSNLAAHNCRHISMYHIIKALIEGGLDE
ncbi:MAG: SAM-dependent methyltransferase [Aliarcobacter sp.]|jgi:hypothetical protein|nr:SAM-dependent methyltransferase [Aliarcobacter sp.]